MTIIIFLYLIFKLNEAERVYMELKGENFNSNLKIWFDDFECETFFKYVIFE